MNLLNARSLRTKLVDFQTSIYAENVDLLIVTETWLTSAILDHKILPSCYDMHHRDRSDRRGGGVLLAVKNDINAVRRIDLESNCELVVVEVCPDRGNKFILCGFYRPPSTKSEYLLELKRLLSKVEGDSTPIYLCGDFNLPDINWDYQIVPCFDNISTLFCEIINDSFLLQINHAPTRITNNTSNILDLVFTNQPERIFDISTFESQISTDHLGVQFKIKITVKRERISRFVYNFKKADLQGLKQCLSFTQLDMGFDENDIDQSWESWHDLFLNTVDSYVPKIRLIDVKSPKWIDSEIISMCRQKDQSLTKLSYMGHIWPKHGNDMT